MTSTLLMLVNGNTIRSTAVTPEDIAGAINAGEKILSILDIHDVTHLVVVTAIVETYVEVTL